MTEPYRDPDGPIHAVLAAANTVASRCHLPDGVSLVHARYQYPACVPEATAAADVDPHLLEAAKSGDGYVLKLNERPYDVDRDVPWGVFRKGGGVLGVVWTKPDSTIEVRDDVHVVRRIAVPESVDNLRSWWRRPDNELDEAKRRTRRDVAGVIT